MRRAIGGLGLATAGAAGITGLAAIARLQGADPGPDGALPVLVGAASVCAALLVRRAAPSVAWLALIGGALVSSAVTFERSRAADPGGLGAEAWTGLALQAAAAALVALAIAAGYATRPGPDSPMWAPAVAVAAWIWLAVACTTAIGLIATGRAQPDPAFTLTDVAVAPLTYFLHLVLGVTAIGAVADVRAATHRAADRQPGQAHGADSDRPDRLRTLAIATARELVPGQSTAAEASLAAERARLAGDLHAVVLPGLRQAIAEAESGGDPDALANRLRSIDLELERLMADRWPVVLDAFGLVSALEDLAERIEADGVQSVTLEIGAVAEERPPPAVERTAWRVAQIALDNAVRHGGGSAISVVIATGPRRVRLVVRDDGRGIDDPPGGPVRKGGRGLADATRRATEIGASLRIEGAANGGTTVDFAWEAAGR